MLVVCMVGMSSDFIHETGNSLAMTSVRRSLSAGWLQRGEKTQTRIEVNCT
jgi:hypothetical protein